MLPMKKIQTTDNQGNEIVSLAMTQFKANDASKSRSDGTLLTVSFNLRNRIGDSTLSQMLYRPCGSRYLYARRLKSAVNKVSSLRDLFGWVA